MVTLGRKDEVEQLINSLINQTYTNFELVIVDQNHDNRVYDLTEKYKEYIDIKYIKSDKIGISYNRNIGMKKCTGDIIAFPDDDCEYETDTLTKVAEFFVKYPEYSFYTCNTKEKNSELSIMSNTFNSSKISVINVMQKGISITIFVRCSALQSFLFDEKLGAGAQFGSAEESDMLFFLLKQKNKGYFMQQNYIYHPAKTDTPERAFLYGKGFGAVHKKAIVKYKFLILFPVFILKLIKKIIEVAFLKNRKIKISSLHGRILGFLQYND
jgi:glycosyltransferase involved in cell wall biosynthesis